MECGVEGNTQNKKKNQNDMERTEQEKEQKSKAKKKKAEQKYDQIIRNKNIKIKVLKSLKVCRNTKG